MEHRCLFVKAALLALASLLAQPGPAQFDGFALYNSANSTTSYLIDKDGAIAHRWTCPTQANYAMALRDNGNIVRGARYANNIINGAAVGGMVQELDPQGRVVWEFVYSTADHVTHHDLCLMPNGNVLLIAWMRQTLAELQAMGYTGNSAKYPGRIIEVKQNGTGGEIVWQWEMKDRFIQYTDPAKPDHLPIEDHPERLDINVALGGGTSSSTDWFHENGIDYNPELDQIAFTSRYLSELFIIDHSTTTEEAAGHTGGNAGMGGDFLFRWGKPSNYNTPGTRTIAGAVHDVRWIKPGRPYAGWLQFVNNVGGPNGSTVIDAINPERDGYHYPRTPGQPWGPASHEWRHQARANASGQSASDRLPNGNVFVALSGRYMYEVDSLDNLVWQYNAGPMKGFRYTCDDPGIIALLGPNPCGLTTGLPDAIPGAHFGLYPNPTTGLVNLTGIDVGQLVGFTLMDAMGREVLRTKPGWTIDLGDNPDGVYHLVFELTGGQRLHRRVVLQR